jgi:hypothetical protein
MNTGPAVAKTVWTQADFDTMSWHDNAVHAVALEPAPPHPGRLLLDLGYILAAIPPEPPATTFSFCICPATLVFGQAWDLTTDINLHGWSFQLFLDTIGRSGPDERAFFEWTLAGDHFTIGLSAPGFTQYLRQARGCPSRLPSGLGVWAASQIDAGGGSQHTEVVAAACGHLAAGRRGPGLLSLCDVSGAAVSW